MSHKFFTFNRCSLLLFCVSVKMCVHVICAYDGVLICCYLLNTPWWPLTHRAYYRVGFLCEMGLGAWLKYKTICKHDIESHPPPQPNIRNIKIVVEKSKLLTLHSHAGTVRVFPRTFCSLFRALFCTWISRKSPIAHWTVGTCNSPTCSGHHLKISERWQMGSGIVVK